MTETWDEKAVFLAALELAPESREAYLQASCPTAEARERIISLLRHHVRTKSDEFPPERTRTMMDVSKLPDHIDEFKILGRIGEGGMGVVYLAEDTVLGRRVALKVLARHLIGSEQALSRFRDEARSAAILNHPAIVPVYKFGFDGENHYIASEYVVGSTLAQVIAMERQRRDSPANTADLRDWYKRCVQIIASIADALDASHRAGIIHRDVKPSNILIDQLRGARLTDFGVAKHITPEAATQATGIVGSCHYMSPEQAAISTTKIDHRSDVFSLGVVFYELLALQRPFEGADYNQILRAVVESTPPRLRSLNKRIPKDLQIVCYKAIEKQPRDRYQSAAHVAADLRSYLAGEPILATPPSQWRRMTRRVASQKLRFAVGLSVLLLLFLTVLSWYVVRLRADRLAWLSVAADDPCALFVQHVDPLTMEIEPRPTSVGTTPLRDFHLEPGQYRLTGVAGNDREFAEVNLIMLGKGRKNRTTVHLHKNSYRETASSNSSDGTTKHGLMTPPDPTGMIHVPAGEYPIGRASGRIGVFHKPVSFVPAFFIDQVAVSNREYKLFVDATGHRAPAHWSDYGYDPSLEKFPVVSVSVEDAEAFARFHGKRLPTIYEWQAATRGPTGLLYPWGMVFDQAPLAPTSQWASPDPKQSRNDRDLYEAYRTGVVAVDSLNPSSQSRTLIQVFGNVREITANLAMPSADGIAAGRCWTDSPRENTLADITTFPIETFAYRNGFRCARSAAVPQQP